ncbi:MAG: deoxyribodipyrimidine photo-lyase [Acidimicrobiia bacterium]
MDVAVVVFTRDLRVTDHPALATACATATQIVPLFVFDDEIFAGRRASANRTAFLLDSLAALDHELHLLGGRLVVRRGSWADTVADVALTARAGAVFLSADVSGFASRRVQQLERRVGSARIDVHTCDGVAVVPAGAVTPGATSAADHYQVFTPYSRRWVAAPRRPIARTPDRVSVPSTVASDALPSLDHLVDGTPGASVGRGGTEIGHTALDDWVAGSLAAYADRHDDLPGDATSRLSAHLHFGCVSPLEAVLSAESIPSGAGRDAFVRQLCWRDFFGQFLAARPESAWSDVRVRTGRWNDDDDALHAWKTGHTGYPVVDAGMRQLLAEGFMHNRARMIVASFLTKDLNLDWRVGARHFLDHLVDGDLALNNLNWQWVAGTGTDTNPNRIFNPTVQGTRFDPDGEYVRRYVAELAALRGPSTHDPDAAVRRAYDYPTPIVDHRQAIEEYRAAWSS